MPALPSRIVKSPIARTAAGVSRASRVSTDSLPVAGWRRGRVDWVRRARRSREADVRPSSQAVNVIVVSYGAMVCVGAGAQTERWGRLLPVRGLVQSESLPSL